MWRIGMIIDTEIKDRVLSEYFELNSKIIKLTNLLCPCSENQLEKQKGISDYKYLYEQLKNMMEYSRILRLRLDE